MSFFSGKKFFLLGFLIVLLFAIPLTVYLTGQKQQVSSQATPATTINFKPPNASINIGDTTSFDVMMNPGTNQVSFVKLVLTYDATKFSVDPAFGLAPNTTNFTVLTGPTYNSGNVSVALSVGSNPAAVISQTTKLATLTLKAIAGTNGSTTPIGVDSSTQVLSIGSADQASENVLASQPAPATATIGGSATSSASTTSSTLTCSSLVLDRAATGTAPYSLTFTATGKDTNGTITKATFTFGDGQVTDVTTGAGLGTNSVNAQISHTYNNTGTYNASVVLTDSGNKTSDPATCKTTITVTSASASSGGGSGGTGGQVAALPTATLAPTAVPVITVTVTPTPTLSPTGPGDKIIGIGAAGIILSVLGGLLLAL